MTGRRRGLLLLLAGGALVLCCTRLIGGGDDDPPPVPAGTPAPAHPPPAVPTGTPAPAPAHPPPAPPASPSGVDPTPYPHPPAEVTGVEILDPGAVPDALAAAAHFVRVWSTPSPQWPAELVDLVTPALAVGLAEPPPPREISGPAYLLLDAPEWARIGVPTDAGTIVLDVAMVDGRWLVSALDWWPGSDGP